MADHALLSPSGASRWLKCTPSAVFETEFPDTESEAAKEGTFAHSVGELILQYKLKLITKQKYEIELKKHQKNKYYSLELFEYCNDYAIFVLEKYYAASSNIANTHIQLETRVNITQYIPEGFGTADAAIVADGTLYLIDLKYGKGVEVSAEDNAQMKAYALGLLSMFEMMYEISNVSLSIYQPRIDNISTWEITVDDLKDWGSAVLKPQAALAFKGEGPYVAGEHCRFCRAKGICKANAELNLQMARHDFKLQNRLTPEEVSDILEKSKQFVNWIGGVEDYALEQAKSGFKWPGMKLVEGRSNRKYISEEDVLKELKRLTFKTDLVTKTSVLPITALEKVVGKDCFEKNIVPLLMKPPGAPTLVSESDKRPELNTADKAAEDFAELLKEG